jgi:hypothetical protein
MRIEIDGAAGECRSGGKTNAQRGGILGVRGGMLAPKSGASMGHGAKQMDLSPFLPPYSFMLDAWHSRSTRLNHCSHSV